MDRLHSCSRVLSVLSYNQPLFPTPPIADHCVWKCGLPVKTRMPSPRDYGPVPQQSPGSQRALVIIELKASVNDEGALRKIGSQPGWRLSRNSKYVRGISAHGLRHTRWEHPQPDRYFCSYSRIVLTASESEPTETSASSVNTVGQPIKL